MARDCRLFLGEWPTLFTTLLEAEVRLPITDVSEKEVYFSIDKMKEMNAINLELVKSFQDIWDKKSVGVDVRRLAKL